MWVDQWKHCSGGVRKSWTICWITNPFQDAPTLGWDVTSVPVGEAEQRVEDARVRDVDLGGAHLPLADALEPGLELADHENGCQQIQVAPHGGVRDAEGPAELGAVPELSVPVREHRPEPAKGRRWDGAAEVRKIPREKRLDEAVPPSAAGGIRTCQVRPRKGAAQPKSLRVADFRQVETVENVKGDAPGERLGSLPQQFGRGAPEHKEASRRPRTIGQNAQQLEDARQPMDLVQDHQATQGAELESGIFQPGEVDRVFQIEPGHGIPLRRCQLDG